MAIKMVVDIKVARKTSPGALPLVPSSVRTLRLAQKAKTPLGGRVLREAGQLPVAHRAHSAHALARVPVDAAQFAADALLLGDYAVDARDELPTAARPHPPVGGAEHEDGGGGRGRRSGPENLFR